jgi:deaminated glutathione amidase
MSMVRIALGQFEAAPEKQPNLARMVAMTEDAARAGAGLVVFPEVAMAYLPEDEDRARHAEPLTGPFVAGLREVAQGTGVAVVAGVLETPESAVGRVYNTAVAIGAGGEVLGTYRKVHMFDAFGHRESERHEPGDGELLLFTLGGVRFGVAICYDLRFPELFRALAERGAEAILLPTAWAHGRLKERHLSTLARARAIENTVYFAAADQVGGTNTGNSELIDPMGVTVAAIGEAEGLVVGDVDGERVARVREVVPTLRHLRPDVYQRWRRVPQEAAG